MRKGQSKQSFKLFLKWKERNEARLQGKLFYESNAHRFIVFFFIASVAFCLQRKADDVPTSSVK